MTAIIEETLTPHEIWNLANKGAHRAAYERPPQQYRVLDRKTRRRSKVIHGAKAARAARDAKNAAHHIQVPANPNDWRYCLGAA